MSSVSVCAETRSASTVFFFFNDTATTEIYTLSLHDALPIYRDQLDHVVPLRDDLPPARTLRVPRVDRNRSEEHTSELQSPCNLVCRLLLEKKKTITSRHTTPIKSSCANLHTHRYQRSPTHMH